MLDGLQPDLVHPDLPWPAPNQEDMESHFWIDIEGFKLREYLIKHTNMYKYLFTAATVRPGHTWWGLGQVTY